MSGVELGLHGRSPRSTLIYVLCRSMSSVTLPDEGAPPLLLAEQRIHHEGGEIEPLVPGIFGELFFQGFDRHRNSPRGNAARRRRHDRVTFRPPSASPC